jgi:hypothetical protein
LLHLFHLTGFEGKFKRGKRCPIKNDLSAYWVAEAFPLACTAVFHGLRITTYGTEYFLLVSQNLSLNNNTGASQPFDIKSEYCLSL